MKSPVLHGLDQLLHDANVGLPPFWWRPAHCARLKVEEEILRISIHAIGQFARQETQDR